MSDARCATVAAASGSIKSFAAATAASGATEAITAASAAKAAAAQSATAEAAAAPFKDAHQEEALAQEAAKGFGQAAESQKGTEEESSAGLSPADCTLELCSRGAALYYIEIEASSGPCGPMPTALPMQSSNLKLGVQAMHGKIMAL